MEIALLLLCLVLLLLFAGRLYLRQDSLVFRPGPDLSRSPADLGLAFEELHLRCEDGTTMHCWWIPKPGSGKALIFFHGSDGNLTHELSTLRFLHSLHVHVLMVDYPGYGKSEGHPHEQGCYMAAEAAWSFVRETKGFCAEDIIIFGQSLGSAVGTYLAASRKCGGLVFQSGFTSVPDLAALFYPYLPVKPFCRTKMNSLQRISQCDCPLLVLHSEGDEHIPIAQAYQVYERAAGPKKFICFEGPHSGSHWQNVPGVRAAWKELLLGQVNHW